METAEEFAQSVIRAFEDDHLLSREALPVFIASEAKARDAAVALAVTDAVLALYRKRSDISWESIEADLAEIHAKYMQPGA